MAEETDAEGGFYDRPDLAGRAREIMDRAGRLLAEAEEAARAGAELGDIERRLADLEAEQRRLDQEFVTVGATTEETSLGDGRRSGGSRWEGIGSWAGNLAETIIGGLGGSLGDSITSLVDLEGTGQVIERLLEVLGPVSVRVENFAGPVRVNAGPVGSVTARAELIGSGFGDASGAELTVTQDDGRVSVRCRVDVGFPGRRYAKLEVLVPEGSPLSVTTVGGRVSVEDVGGPATLRTAGGTVRLRGASGDSDVATAGGGIEVEAHLGGGIRAVTMGGSVVLRGRLTGAVETQTSGGSIRVEGAAGPVRAHTAGGSVTVSGEVLGDWSLRTAGGSVTAHVPADANAVVDASGGAAHTDFDWLRAGRRVLRGRLGDGQGGHLTLRSLGGSVSVRRLDH